MIKQSQNPPNNDDKKQIFRQQCKKQLKKNHTYFAKKNLLIQTLQNLLISLRPKNVLLYMPMSFEVDIYPLILWLRRTRFQQGKIKVFVPKIREISFDSVEFRLHVRKNNYGIYEPESRAKTPKIDLMLVPILGIDQTFRRIGFGKGMYDRFYARLKHKPKVIFITKKLYFSSEIITQDHDIKGDYLICDDRIMQRDSNDRNYYYQLADKRRVLRRSGISLKQKNACCQC